MNKAKLKRIGMLVLSVFGIVVLVAAYMRAKKQSDATPSVNLTAAMKSELMSVTKTS